MTEQKDVVAELRRLAEAATPGEWRAGVNDTDCVFGDVNNRALMAPDFGRVLLRTNHHFPVFEADARFIAAANPATVLKLLAVVEAADTFSRIFEAADDEELYFALVDYRAERAKIGP